MATKSRVEKASFILERLVVGLVRGPRLMSKAQGVKENSASHLIQDVQINIRESKVILKQVHTVDRDCAKIN